MKITYGNVTHGDHASTYVERRLKLWHKEEHLPKKRRPINVNGTTLEVPQNLDAIVAGLSSDDPVTQLDANIRLCTLLSIGDNPPIEQVVQSKTLVRLVEFLASVDSSPKLQLQAAWALTNIASGTTQQTQAVIDSGAVPILVKLLFSASSDVCEQAVWALGNIAGDSPQCRNYVLGCGALKPLLALLHDQRPLPMMQKATWTLCNLCRGTPLPAMTQTLLALEDLKRLVRFDDEDILTDTCWALYYLSDGHRDEEYQAVSNANVLPRLVELLGHCSHSVNYAALCALGNLVRHDASVFLLGGIVHTKNIINNGGLPLIRNLLTNKHHTVGVKKEACWLISRFTAGSFEEIQAVVDANIVSVLVELVESAEFSISKQAMLAIKFLAYCGTDEQVRHLVDHERLKPVCGLLGSDDAEVLSDCLESIYFIFKRDVSSFGPFFRCHVGDQLRVLQQHIFKDIRDYAKELLQALDESDSGMAAGFAKSTSFNGNEIVTVQASLLRKRSYIAEYTEVDDLEKRYKAALDAEHDKLLFEVLGMLKGKDRTPLPFRPIVDDIPPWLRK